MDAVVWMGVVTDLGWSMSGGEFNIAALFYKIFGKPRTVGLELTSL
jgi:hypothetical protein